MNNKQFLSELSARCRIDEKKASDGVQTLVSVMEKVFDSGDTISISGFGVLEVKKKGERVSVNPVTGVRMLVPPKLAISYKPSSLLKDKLK